MLRGGMTGALLAVGVALPAPALAGDLDFRLGRSFGDDGVLFSCASSPCGENQDAFRDFVSELGFAFSPRTSGPADTLGRAGFHVGVAYGGTFVSSEEHWTLTDEGQRSGDPSRYLQTIQLGLRKGLPWSFELGARMAWLLNSEMLAPGAELRWSFQEGYDYLPDFGVRLAATTLLGARDLDLTVLAADVVISDAIAVGGTVQVTPFVGWGLVLTGASSKVVDPTPGTVVPVTIDGATVLQPDVDNDLVFETSGFDQDVGQKLSFGTRIRVHVVDLILSGELQMFARGEPVGPVGSFGLELGLSY